MRLIAHTLAAALIAAALAAPPALAMPDKGPIIERHDDFGVSDAGQQSRPLPGPPTWPVDPQPLDSVRTPAATSDDGLPWDTIVVGLAGAGLALGCAGTVVGLRRRAQRPRVAA